MQEQRHQLPISLYPGGLEHSKTEAVKCVDGQTRRPVRMSWVTSHTGPGAN